MKKVFISIFAFLYLGLSCGFAYDTHFCMGRVSSVELFHTGNNACGKCGMKNMAGCCNSKLTVVKINDSQQLSNCSLNIAAPLTAVLNNNFFTISKQVSQHIYATINDTSPPPVSGAFLCILNSVFTI